MSTLNPIHDNVVVQTIDEEPVTAGGIVIPNTAKDKPVQGTVLAIGPGKVGANGEFVATVVPANSTVLFHKGAGTEVKFEGNTVRIMRESDIIAIVKTGE